MNQIPLILAPSSMDNTVGGVDLDSRQHVLNMNVDLRSKSVIVEDSNTPGGIGVERTSTQLSQYDYATQQNTPNNQSSLNRATLPMITTVRLAKRL